MSNTTTATTLSRWAFLREERIHESLGLSKPFADQCERGLAICVSLFEASTEDHPITQADLLETMINAAQPTTILESYYAGYCVGMLFQKFMQDNEQADRVNKIGHILKMLAKGQDTED